MPLSDQSGLIARVPQHFRQGVLMVVDQHRIGRTNIGRLRPSSPAVASSQQTVAGGATDGMRGMGVGELPAFNRQPINVGRPYLCCTAGAQVTVAEVVGQDENYIRPVSGKRIQVGRERRDREC